MTIGFIDATIRTIRKKTKITIKTISCVVKCWVLEGLFYCVLPMSIHDVAEFF